MKKLTLIAAIVVLTTLTLLGCGESVSSVVSTPTPKVVYTVDAVVGADTAQLRASALENANAALEAELDDARQKLDVAYAEIDASGETVGRLEDDLAESVALAVSRESEIASLEARVSELETLLESATPVTDATWDGPENPSWTSVNAPGDQASIDAGNLVRWADRYYAAHAWTVYGGLALSANVGDRVTIDGLELIVKGVFTLSGDTTVEDVRTNAGWDTYVMQTCEDETNAWHRHLVMEPA